MKRPARVPTTLVASAALLGFALPAPVAALGVTSSPAGQRCDWRVVDSPDLGHVDSALGGVDAVTPDDIWAVGTYGRFSQTKTLVEHFDGDQWSVVSSPNPRRLPTDGNELLAVDAITATDVWAVGTHLQNGQSVRPLIQHFDGDRWRTVANPPGRGLAGGFLRSVSAASADDVWAVGATTAGRGERNPLALHWDGSEWSIAKVPNPRGFEGDFLAGVSALASDDVWAVGQAREATTLTLHFDGDRWRIVPSPDPGGGAQVGLSGVVARATDVWAVGAVSSIAGSISLHWTGAHWKVVPTQHRPQFDSLAAVATTSSGDLWTVGINQTPESSFLTFAQHFDGTTWKLSKTPSPGLGDRLLGVTVADQDVWAVGVTADSPGTVGHALIEHRC